MQKALESALAELALGALVDPADSRQVESWLLRHNVAPADAEYLKSTGLQRLLTYRRLVRANLRDAIEVTMPRVVRRLGPLFDEYFDLFLEKEAPRTHFLRDVTPEFLTYCAPLWALDARIRPYLFELADHEALEIEIAAMPDQVEPATEGELALDRGVRFIGACRIVSYQHAIHELSEDEDSRAEPRVEPTWLLVYRNDEHEVKYLKLTRLAATILTRLIELGETLGTAVQNACREQRVELDESVLNGTASVLADLADRHVLLGPEQSPIDDGGGETSQ